MSFDEQGRQQRLDDAASRAADRSGPNDDKSIAGSGATLSVLGVGIGSLMIAAGVALMVVGFGAVGLLLTLGGGAAAVAGVVAGRSGRGSGTLISAAAPPQQRRLTAAYETARDAIDAAPGVEEEHKVEITAALRAALDETLAAESERAGLVAAMHNLPEDPSAAGDRLKAALVDLDKRAQDFLDQCARLQASVATLAIGSDKGRAMQELREAAGDLTSRAAAERELTETLAGPRSKQTDRG